MYSVISQDVAVEPKMSTAKIADNALSKKSLKNKAGLCRMSLAMRRVHNVETKKGKGGNNAYNTYHCPLRLSLVSSVVHRWLR